MSGVEVALIASAVIGAGATAASVLSRPKQIQPTPRPTRLEARERADERDRVAQRTGTRANRRVGFGAGEASTGQRTSLLGRSGG